MKIVYIKNRWLGTVGQRQDITYAGHCDAPLFGDSLPVKRAAADVHLDYFAVARYRVQAARVTSPCDFESTHRRLLANPEEPYVSDAMVAREQHVPPRIPVGATYRNSILRSLF